MAQPRKQSGEGYAKLKKDLADGTLGNLYILYGEEAYLRDYYLGKMKEQLVGGGMAQFNLHECPAKELTARRLEEMVDALPMMSERTMVLIADYDLFKAPQEEREAYAALLAKLPEYCCVVFVYDLIEYKPDGRVKLGAVLREHAQAVEFARQSQGDLVDWVYRRFRALDKEIDSEQARYLIFRCGDLMHTLIGEIEKAGAYAKGKRVTREDIDAVTTPQMDAVVFQMTDAIGAGDFDRAAKVMGELLQMQEAPIRILYTLGRHMRQLYCARLLLEEKKDAGELARLWGIKDYPAQKLMGSARRFSLAWCRGAVIRCARADKAMKSDRAGNDGEVLTDLLLSLSVPHGGKRG